MLKTIFRGLVLILVSLPFALPVNAQSSHNEFAFAYIQVISNTTLALVRLNPADLDHTYPPILLSVPEGLSLTVATSSPSGEWVFLEFSSNLTSVIQAYNAITGELHTIANDTFAVSKGVSDFQAWSPDSEYFAMYVDYRNGGSAMLVYSLLNKTWINLTGMRDSAEQLAWSQDSAYILTSHSYCVSTSGCELFFDKYAIPSGIGETYAVDTGLCNIQWSPDGLYAAFVNACYPTFGVTSARELHILDVQQENYERITNNTIGLRSQYPNHQIDGEYHTYWYNNDTLLVGSTFTNGLGTRGTETFLYNVVTQQKNLITPDAIFNWTPNPVYNKLAFQRVTGFTSPDGYIFNPINSVIQVATFNGTTLQTVASGPSGCNLNWSPDGQYLVYEKLEKPLCEYSQLVSIVFVSQATGALQEYSAPSTLNRTIGIGWLKIPTDTTSRQSQPSTATLREALSAAECERACWMGIEPGVTTASQAQAILHGLGIDYDVVEYVEAHQPISYVWRSDRLENISARIDIIENTVRQVQMPVKLSISEIVAEWGLPSKIEDRFVIWIAYYDKGILFSAPRDADYVSEMYLMLPSSLQELYMLPEGGVPAMTTCNDVSDAICELITTSVTQSTNSANLRELLETPHSGYGYVAYHPQGHRIALSNRSVIDIYTSELQFIHRIPIAGTVLHFDMSWSPDGLYLAAATTFQSDGTRTYTETLYLWDATTFTQVDEIPGIIGVGKIAWSADSSQIAATYFDENLSQNVIGIYEIKDGTQIASLPQNPWIYMYWSHSTNTILAASADIVLWNATTHERIGIIPDQANTELPFVLSPDGKQVAFIALNDPTRIKIWNIQPLRYIRALDNPSPIEHLDWGIQGILVASFDGVRIWDVQTGMVKLTIPSGRIIQAILNPDGIRLITLGIDNTTTLRDAAVAEVLATLDPGAPLTIATPIPANATLREVLSAPGCPTACWMGISRRVTTEDEFLHILAMNGISYEKSEMLNGEYWFYSVKSGYTHPLVNENFEQPVAIVVTGDVVSYISIGLKNVFIDDVVAQYGYPARLVHDGGASVKLVYPEFGLVFLVVKADGNMIYSVSMLDEEGVNLGYMNPDDPFLEDFPPCTEPTQLCALTTATPMP